MKNLTNLNSTVLSLLVQLDAEVISMLEELDDESKEALKADPPFWVETLNIDLDSVFFDAEEHLAFWNL